jgi:hypothetical protein
MIKCTILECNVPFIMRYHALIVYDLSTKVGTYDLFNMFIMGGEL